MDWLQFLEIICVPAFGWLVYDLSCTKRDLAYVKRDLADFKLKVAEEAKNYATNEAILRMESKIDDLRDLIIDEMKTKKVGRK